MIRHLLFGLLAFGVMVPAPTFAQAQRTYTLRPHTVRSCKAADSLFGHMWRTQVSRIPAYYDRSGDYSVFTTPLRTVSWQVGTSRIAGTEMRTQVPGKGAPGQPSTIVLSVRLVDSVPRLGDALPLLLTLNDTLPFELRDPMVSAVTGVSAAGVPLYVSYDLTLDQLRILAGARKAEGTIGPHKVFFYDWELLDINAVFRGLVCGVSL